MGTTRKYTIADFNRNFTNEDDCLEAIVAMVYPDGIVCRKCGIVRPHARITGRKAYACDYCGTHVYPLAGTIFEKSTTALKSWFYAMYLMGSTRCGISAKQLERELGVTYKTAWRMFTQIRKLMEEDGGPLHGEVEVDETWVGGKQGNKAHVKHSQNAFDNKIPVIGAVERGGRVRARVIPNVRKSQLVPLVIESIRPDAKVFTDESKGYTNLSKHGYAHERVNHKAKVYVHGNVHTNTIEGFWSLLKNGIRGAHHSVGAGHLQAYVDEYVFRYNHRDDARPMFETITNRVVKTRHGRYGGYAPVG
jgi:transposase